MNSPIEVLPPELFEQALLERVERYPTEESRFVQLLRRRNCPLPVLQRYARSTLLSARNFTARISELIKHAPNEAARLPLLENLMEEEGIFLVEGKGLDVRPEASHPALAMRFVIACETDDRDLEQDSLNLTSPGESYLAEGRWLEAIAFLLIGQELKFATTSAIILQALLDQGFERRDLAFFSVHIEADLRHGREALSLVVNNAHNATDQQAALDAAEAGARYWFELHGGASRARR